MAGCNPWQAFWGSGILTIATASFLFSVGTLAVRFLEDRIGQMPAFQVACIPSFCCSLVCSGVLLGQREPPLGRSVSHAILNILRGIFGASSLIFFYMSVNMLPLKDAVTLFFTSPMIAVLLEWICMGVFPGFQSLLGCVLTVVGVVLVTQPADASNPDSNALLGLPLPDLSNFTLSPGVICSLIAATSNAISFVVVQALAGRTSPIGLTWWYHTAVTLSTAVPIAMGYPEPPRWPTALQQGMLVFIVVCQLGGQICLNRGFSLVSATRGAAINVLQVVFSYVWELTILHEAINLMSAAGGGFVMAGVIVVAMSGGAHRPSKATAEVPTLTRASSARDAPQLQEQADNAVSPVSSTHAARVYDIPATGGTYRPNLTPAAAALVGSPGLEVFTAAMRNWQRPSLARSSFMEPLLEGEPEAPHIAPRPLGAPTETDTPNAVPHGQA